MGMKKREQQLVGIVWRLGKLYKNPYLLLQCPNCNEKFKVSWEFRNRVFCCTECGYEYGRRAVKVKCSNPNCNTIFEMRLSNKERMEKEGRLYYCGHKCANICLAKQLIESGKMYEKFTDEVRRKMSERMSGENNPMYGKEMHIRRKIRISQALKGSKSNRKGLTWDEFYGTERAEEIRMKAKESKRKYYETHLSWNKGCSLIKILGAERALEVSKIYSEAQKDKKHPWSAGKNNPTCRPEVGEKISKTRIRLGRSKGRNNPMYVHGEAIGGGVQYGNEFTNELKTKIRKRDKFICNICSKTGIVVHHIDYDKYNSSERNLIILCKTCHNKTNTPSQRKNWQLIFEDMIREKYKCTSNVSTVT